MKLLARLSAAAVLSVAIAWALSFLPDIRDGAPGSGGDLTVFRMMKPILLTEDNLVDWLIEMPLKLELDKVEWSHQILAMDFETDEKKLVPDNIYSQMLDSVYQGLAGTTNVERVQIRIFDPTEEIKGKQRLLIALDAGRGQFRTIDLEKWREKRWSAEEWLNNRFQLTRTTRWKQLLSETVR